jgi:hypothetical protein
MRLPSQRNTTYSPTVKTEQWKMKNQNDYKITNQREKLGWPEI